ncbi:AI-2E family transporter [Bradyrhizobium sp. WBOS7]|uniref:AI-2E family transporter n=1 Tax=Bradyrhizobium betae TaxID=244734 RepID=A0AAE9SUD8_9BRAD|nr:AI-2E family transporter [Bradyrhizobium sp. WBOS2]MDD1570892.1 AI-2E family transporter [Bradyrhizobium sp. WBOS1]MDD1577532.1 AI-2E family transporter [Bradyrhizobium sp. WBOS7]MDD1600477.1 AI-2E family transporter [Bradyrhizobium sp. WBOS16]UUO35154.1 AI-2E family transporter [Bradyrhizobium sp. WBOS01]UUO41464.1 AI-2E family transporter [Bradyrhizobium sp. WBOS02]UUO55801.1 AI-2E family transporter [Bradyrhizobium sp. WBOS07]UUO65791.1 AI-2E family transporter [Bradyrhizobium betae]
MEPRSGSRIIRHQWARGARLPCGREIVRVLPSESLIPGNSAGDPLPDSRVELPPVIRRTEFVAFALAGLLLIAVVTVLYVGRAFFLPVVMAFVTGTMLSPAAGFLERYKVPRAVGAVLIVAAGTAVVAFVVALIASPAIEWSTRLPELGARLKDKLHVFDRPLSLWRETQAMLGGSEGLPSIHMPKVEWVQPTLEFLSPTFTEFLLFFVTLILFIASWRDLRRAMIMNFGGHDARLRTLRILNEIEEHLGNYLLTVTLINVGVGVATGLICALTGMPNPAGLGALAATLNFIPIIGPVAMFVVLVVVGLVAFPTISGGLMAALAFGGLTFLEGHFITPTIIGRRLALNALAVLLALAFWTWMWGPMGAFLSSPLLIVALILKEHLLPADSPQLPRD